MRFTPSCRLLVLELKCWIGGQKKKNKFTKVDE